MQVDEQASEHLIQSQQDQEKDQRSSQRKSKDVVDKENQVENVIEPSKAKFDKFKEEVKQREATAMRNIIPQFKVDAQCEVSDVVVFGEYSCKLSRQDLEFSANSRDSFIRMQLLERNDRKKWFLWIGEGKVGKAQIKTKIFDHFNKVDAIASFEKKFAQWTENMWAERDYFQPKQGKFVIGLAEREKTKLEAAQQTQAEIMRILSRAGLDSKVQEVGAFDQADVEPEVFELLQLAWDMTAFKQTLTDSQLDTTKLPMGVLSHEKIKKSNTILNEVNKLLLKNSASNAAREQQLIDLTDHFYQTLPYDFGLKRPVNLDHLRRVKDKVKLMEVIADICTAERCLLNALVDLRENNPVQTLRHELLTLLKPISRTATDGPDSGIFDVIYKSITNTTSDFHKANFTTQVRHVFHATKPSQKLSFMPFERRLHNKFLLWFGCRPTSLVATMRDGLRLQPAEAPATSLRFGKGIYLTDCFSRAASQCIGGDASASASGKPKQGLVFLVEVALGDMHIAHQPEPLMQQMPSMTHSVYGVGAQKPDVRGIVDLKSNLNGFALNENATDTKSQLFFNTGKMRANPDLNADEVQTSEQRFNDFVVFDPAQVRLKYAVLCDFFKTGN